VDERVELRRIGAAAIGLAIVLTVACGGGGSRVDGADRAAQTRTNAAESATDVAPRADTTWVATATIPEVAVYTEPEASEPSHRLANPNENGAPLVFLVDGIDASGDWVPVHLPVRPNGSKGWIRASDVTLAQNDYRMTVELSAHRLRLTKGGELVVETPVGVGTTDTPTPGGVYYIKELLLPPDPDGAYGPYAYGLSGFSNNPELATFNGGTGVIGIHGTNDPATVGQDVSHGCIRLTNDVITELAGILPLGTPVDIRP
jgi:lipoprotein-anchoring transpeptidase ErfK/SrfK